METLRAAMLVIATICSTLPLAQAHEMFLRPAEFVLPPETNQEIRLINGNFNRSENSIGQERMAEVSIVTLAGTTNPPESACTTMTSPAGCATQRMKPEPM